MSESNKRRRLEVPTASMSVLNFCDDVLEKIFGYFKKPIERNAISAVCKRFHELEARTRYHVLVYNMYVVNPMKLFERFPSVTSITLKGNPRLVDFDIVPREWAGHAGPWIEAIKAHPQLIRFRIKRMMITDHQIEDLCAACGANLKILIFDKCTGFSSAGLESLSKYCKKLTTLGLSQSIFDSNTGWLKKLADNCLSLEVLDLSLIEMGEVEEEVLVKLATRCKTLKLWESQNPERFQPVLEKCSSNLVDLGIERINSNSESSMLAKCTALEGLYGIFDLVDDGMEAFLSVSSRLKRLDLSYSGLGEVEIAQLLNACPNLQQLRVLDLVGDHGLQALGSSCKDLHRLVVESPSASDGGLVTHAGLIAVAQGCRNLQKLIFYPSYITNEAFETLAYNCPNLMDVRICLIHHNSHNDQMPWDSSLDAGVGALVKQCQSLYRLTLCFDVHSDVNLLTDTGVSYIGKYGKNLRMLTLVGGGSSDAGLLPILNGCSKLQRLEIRKCPFGDESMSHIANKHLHLKYLFVQGCEVSLEGLKNLTCRGKITKSRFYVEVIGCRKAPCIEEHRESCPDPTCAEEHSYSLSCSHWQILAYHSLTEPRTDMPGFIHRFDPTLPESSLSSLPLSIRSDPISFGSSSLLELMPETGIDLNEPPEREDDSSFAGFSNGTFMFPHMVQRGSSAMTGGYEVAEPSLHLMLQEIPLL